MEWTAKPAASDRLGTEAHCQQREEPLSAVAVAGGPQGGTAAAAPPPQEIAGAGVA